MTIPDSVESIGPSVFEGCYSLTSVTIGNGITSIGYIFNGCDNLTSVTFEGKDVVTVQAMDNYPFGLNNANW